MRHSAKFPVALNEQLVDGRLRSLGILPRALRLLGLFVRPSCRRFSSRPPSLLWPLTRLRTRIFPQGPSSGIWVHVGPSLDTLHDSLTGVKSWQTKQLGRFRPFTSCSARRPSPCCRKPRSWLRPREVRNPYRKLHALWPFLGRFHALSNKKRIEPWPCLHSPASQLAWVR